MSDHRKTQVTIRLARRVGMPPGEALARAWLKQDLRLEPLDIVLFVLSFEESDDAAFRFEELEHVRTAGELVQTVTRWLEQYDRHERSIEADEEPHDYPAGAA